MERFPQALAGLFHVGQLVVAAAMGADSEVYNIRPSFREKFRPAAVKPLITAVLAERLADKS